LKKNLIIIYTAFAFSILILVVVSIVTSRQVTYLLKYTDQIAKTDQVINLLSEVETQLYKAESNQRGFLITKDSAYFREFQATAKTIYPIIDSLKKVIPDEKHKNDLIKIHNTVATRFMILQQATDDFFSGDKARFDGRVAKGDAMMQDFKTRTLRFQKEQVVLLAESEAKKLKYELAAPAYLRLIFILTLLLQAFSFLVIVKEFRRRFAYQKSLEQNIQEINMSHAELEQIAFIASHDLQEPLRKIRTFGGKLLMQNKETISQSGRTMLERMDYAARRMQGLIEDVVDYTNLINSTEEKQEVNLNDCLRDVQESLENLIENRRVEIKINDLPAVKGYPYQLHLLFTNLIHNSIKFSKQGVKPVIQIEYAKIDNDSKELPEKSSSETYGRISISDNGIGFENEFAKKIFVIFQRLHNQKSKYEGKGIGLSICKRVMTNHNGFIKAEGEVGHSATFHLYFPI
jgi:signal transduction histidine kinase